MKSLFARSFVVCVAALGILGIAEAQDRSSPGLIIKPPMTPTKEQEAEAEAFTAAFSATVRSALLNDKCAALSLKDTERVSFFAVTLLETIRGDIGSDTTNRIIDDGNIWAKDQPCGEFAAKTIRDGLQAGQQAMENRLGATTASGIDFYELVAADLLIRKCGLFQNEKFDGKGAAVHLSELATAIANTAEKLEPGEELEIRVRTAAKFEPPPDACGLRSSIIAMIGLVKSEVIRTSIPR